MQVNEELKGDYFEEDVPRFLQQTGVLPIDDEYHYLQDKYNRTGYQEYISIDVMQNGLSPESVDSYHR